MFLLNGFRIAVFKYVPSPISLILTSKSHALFHAVRYGNGFITEEVIQALLSNGVTLSRYFVQRSLMHFGTYDERLIELKI